jgi:NADPH:quinone reductase-like Zn-dependent oxidoreductase
MARALAITDKGEAPTVQDLPYGNAGAERAVIRVRAASVNGIDAYVAAGYVWDSMAHQFPVVLGRDFAGVVEQVGPDVSGLQVGDRVAGVITGMDLYVGAMTEELAIEAGKLTRMPDEVTFQEAAAVGLAGSTARDMVEALRLTADDTVLVSGATGGVGVFAVQLAAATGATVVATGRPGLAEPLSELGATHVVDYADDLAAAVREVAPDGVTAVAHSAGDAATVGALLKPDGRLASVIGATAEQVGRDDITVTAVQATSTPQGFGALLAAVGDRRLKVPVFSTYPLDDSANAISAFGEHKLGKLVVTLD